MIIQISVIPTITIDPPKNSFLPVSSICSITPKIYSINKLSINSIINHGTNHNYPSSYGKLLSTKIHQPITNVEPLPKIINPLKNKISPMIVKYWHCIVKNGI